MNELSLFSGAGGGLLGTKLLGWNHIGYVEYNEYCQQVIAQRIKDGFLNEAPIFTDVREFIQSGAARQYRGFADVVTAGFPCQPHSRIGKRSGKNDDRNLWPETIAVIRTVRPRFVLLENSPGILDRGYAGTVCAELAVSGYMGSQFCLSAGGLGAYHQRRRIWWVAVDSYANCIRLQGRYNSTQRRQAANRSIQRLVQNISWPDVSDPYAYGSNDELAYRVDRTKAVGNGQVPSVVATAWRILTDETFT